MPSAVRLAISYSFISATCLYDYQDLVKYFTKQAHIAKERPVFL